MRMRKKNYLFGAFILAVLFIALSIYFKNSDFLKSTLNTNDYTNIEVGKEESCLQCHQNTTGYSNYHNPDLIGCSSCHLGNISASDKDCSLINNTIGLSEYPKLDCFANFPSLYFQFK